MGNYLSLQLLSLLLPLVIALVNRSSETEGKLMADNRERDRMVLDTTEVMKRAVRLRAAVDGVRPADVVNAGLRLYLAREIASAQERMESESGKPSRGRTGKGL